MIGYVVRRLLLAVSLVWGVSFGAFVAFGLSFDPTYQFNLCPTPECAVRRAQIVAAFHLHDPILLRYWSWFSGLFSHGFGKSPAAFYPGGIEGDAIGPELWHAAGISAQLLCVSLVLVVVASVFVGVVSARFAGSPLDWLVRLLAYLAWSTPTFLVGVLLVRWLGPTQWFWIGRVGPGVTGWLRWIALPSISLALGLVGLYSRYIRSTMLVSLRQPYADVARGKGLSERRVVLGHALRNSLVPFVSVLALDLAAVVGASMATDYVFGMGGLADYFLHSIGGADPFVLTAILVVIAGVVASLMFLADLVVGWLDPRARAGVTL
jgi:peptide/nickel transport system permease protein